MVGRILIKGFRCFEKFWLAINLHGFSVKKVMLMEDFDLFKN